MNKVITIDGTTASGKGTLAKKLEKYLNLPYLNTGALYRSIALYLHEKNIDYTQKNLVIQELNNVSFDNLERKELYDENIAFITSKIASIQEVRNFLFDLQVNFTKNENGAILDGRDIGTVICPTAKYKFFIIADTETRAKRRFKEMQEKNISAEYNDILNKIIERDKKDFEREIAPLKKAKDAVEIDTTNMNPDEVLKYALKFIDIQK